MSWISSEILTTQTHQLWICDCRVEARQNSTRYSGPVLTLVVLLCLQSIHSRLASRFGVLNLRRVVTVSHSKWAINGAGGRLFVQFVLMLLVQFIKPPLRLEKKKERKKRKPRQQREGVCLLVWDCGCKGRKTPKVGCEKSSRISEMIRDFDRFYKMTRHLSTRLPREQLGMSPS